MSETQSMFASLLDYLDREQQSVPQNGRGLNDRLTDLRERLTQDPALEENKRFRVEVAWLVQDWKNLSGTGREVFLPPREASEMRHLSVNLPGLENEDVKTLLRNSEGLRDHGLMAELRKEALRIAELEPGEQLAHAIVRGIAVLDWRVEQAKAAPVPNPAPAQAAPRQAPSRPAEPEQPRQASKPPAQEPAAPPRQQQTGVPAQDGKTQREKRQAPPPQAEQEGSEVLSREADARMRQEDQGKARAAQTSEPLDQNEQAQKKPPIRSESTPGQEEKNQGDRARASNATPSAPTPAPTMSLFPPQAPKAERTGPGVIERLVEAGKDLGTSFSGWTENMGDARDQRRMKELATKVEETVQEVDDNISAFRTKGASFIGDLEKTAQRDGKSHQEIIAGMHEKGPYARLRGQFDKALAENPELAEQHTSLQSSLHTLNNRVRNLNMEAGQSGMEEASVVRKANEALAPLADRLEKLPSTEPGANMLERAGAFVTRIVENIRRFLDHLRGREPGPDRDAGPSQSR
ncbi:hypothetical protein [Asaia sp. VD9]|uniref:hypothetical protein n=1 Tax=Asaia sp. VD9 TaxID=3081235 RepID=UPI00301A2E0B